MGTDTPAAGGEQKPVVKNEGKPRYHGGRNNANRNNNYVKKERFLGADPDLSGKVFEAKRIRSEQVANFKTVDDIIKAQVGTEYDPLVLESLEKEVFTAPSEPTPVYKVKAKKDDPDEMTRVEEMKFKSKFDKYLSRHDKVETQLKQVFSKYYGQISEDMIASLEEDADYKRAYEEKDVIALRKMLRAVNFDYKKTEEPIKTLWQANKDLINMKQHKMTTQEYYDKFKSLNKVVQELNHSEHGSPFIDIMCRETGADPTGLSSNDKLDLIAKGEERMLAMQLIMNADKDRFGSIIEDYDRAFLRGTNNYPQNPHDAYNLLKGWNKGQPHQNNRNSFHMAFNTNGEEENGTALVNNGEKQKCTRCGRDNHTIEACVAKRHLDGTVLHIMGYEEVEHDVSTEPTDQKTFGPDLVDYYCGDELEELMFLQPHEYSPTKRQNISSKTGIKDTWMLLDSQSTVDVFSNSDLLTKIHKTNTILRIRCNAGMKTTEYKGYLSGYGWVWYYPDGIANILSLSRVKDRFRVTFDSATDNCFRVHKDNGKILKFREATRRLYYFDTEDRDVEETMLITTVDNNKSRLSAHDFSRALLARALQRKIGRPMTKDFIRYVALNLIPNCPVTVQDIKNAEFVWGPELGCLKGKTTRQPSPKIRLENMPIPAPILQQYRDVTLSVDIMKVTGIPFLMTISRHIKFGSAGRLDTMKNSHIIKHFKALIGTYVTRGFRVTIILADNQFESMRGDLADLHATLHITSRDEHVPEVERYNRTIKERVRGNYTMLPYQHLPPIFVIEMVYNAVFWRNMFALKGGVSKTQSPSELVLGRKVDYNAHCKVEFGEYVQTHEEHSNDMTQRTLGAIATRPSNDAGSYYFVSLLTGKRINRRSWTSLPMPEEAVNQVHRLARRANATKKLTFTDVNNEDLDLLYQDLDLDDDDEDELEQNAQPAGVDDDDDDDHQDPDYNPEDDSDADSEDENESEGEDENANENNENEAENEAHEDDEDVDDEDVENPGVDESNDDVGVGTPGVDVETPGVDESDEDDETTGVDNVDDDEAEQNEERTSGSMNLRNQPRKLYNRKDYNVFNIIEETEHDDIVLLQIDPGDEFDPSQPMINEETDLEVEYTFLTEDLGWKEGLDEENIGTSETSNMNTVNVTKLAEYMFLTEQMGWKKGLRVLGERGEEAIEKELKQIHDMEGFQPKHWHELSKEERTKALKYLMYLKEKRDGRIKGRGCADGRPQRLYTTKSETSSPTASLAGIMLTCMIDAFEKRDVATVDIPGAFLQTKMPEDEEDVHVILDGRMAELLAKIAPDTYQKYVHQSRGQSYIYCKVNVAIYGTLKAALLFWKKLSASLKMRGFEVNPYDWCIANKIINGSQCTIVWHVDDLKISHKDPAVVDGIIASLNAEYGKVGEMTVRRGHKHDYLGMVLDFSNEGKFVVDMEDYLKEMINDLPDDMDGMATTPAADHLFKVRDNAPKLNETKADLFHRVTAQLLFVAQRGRPDLRTAVSFLTKRVQEPDEDDYKKLARAIKYIRRTLFLRLTIEATYLDQNHWFIDGAFAVHKDMKSHTGAYMTFGKGMIDGSSKTQKINTTSSTEAEVVAVHENMPAILWIRYFLEAQGYPLKPSIIHQDNESSELLETNGRGSSSKRTRHMNIRYFFVADVFKRGHITIEHCPTDEMIGDFFTKPVGGAKFRRFRNIIMNIDHDEYGPVDVDALMTVHNEKMQKRIELSNDESTISKKSKMSADKDSQECVGNVRFDLRKKSSPRSSPKRSNTEWAAIRGAHKAPGIIRRTNSGRAPRRSYAEVAASSE